MTMFEDFSHRQITTPEAVINLRHGGNGPPLLLLHGHPQTHAMWHRIAPALAKDYTVVCADLRGYGDSSKPPTTPDHEPYSKRAMARDQVGGHARSRFRPVRRRRPRSRRPLRLSHGARSSGRDRRACRFSISCPRPSISSAPTCRLRMGYWHWFFLAQPFDLPERLISADPDAFYLRRGRSMFDPAALAEYRRCFHQSRNHPRHVRGLSRRRRHRHATRPGRSQKPAAASLAPFRPCGGAGSDCLIGTTCAAIWRDWADGVVEGHGIDCGHYLAEEAPAGDARGPPGFSGAQLRSVIGALTCGERRDGKAVGLQLRRGWPAPCRLRSARPRERKWCRSSAGCACPIA